LRRTFRFYSEFALCFYSVCSNEPSDYGQGSLDDEEKPLESDTDSLGDYEDQDPSKFNEDGSFIGQYTRRGGPSAPGTYNTFV